MTAPMPGAPGTYPGHADATQPGAATPMPMPGVYPGHADATQPGSPTAPGAIPGHAQAATVPMADASGAFPGHAQAAPGATAPMPTADAAFPGHAQNGNPMPLPVMTAAPGHAQGGQPGAPNYAGPPGGEQYGQPGAPVDPEAAEDREKIAALLAVRTWTDATGQHKFEGKFVEYTNGKVTLQRANVEETIMLEMKQLSDFDQRFVRDGLKAQTSERNREERLRKLRRPRGQQ